MLELCVCTTVAALVSVALIVVIRAGHGGFGTLLAVEHCKIDYEGRLEVQDERLVVELFTEERHQLCNCP